MLSSPNMSFLSSRPEFSQSATRTRSFSGRLESLQRGMAPRRNFYVTPDTISRYDLNGPLPFAQPIKHIRPPSSTHQQSLSSICDASSIHDRRNLGSMAPLFAPAFPIAISDNMEKISHSHHPVPTPIYPPGLPLIQGIYPPSTAIIPDSVLQPSLFATLPLTPPPPPTPPVAPTHGYHPSLTPIVELSPYVDSSRSIGNSHSRNESSPPHYVTPTHAPSAAASIGLGIPMFNPTSPFLDPTFSDRGHQEVPFRASAEPTPQISLTDSPSPVSTPRTPHSVGSSVAARLRSDSIRQLALSPLSNDEDIVEILTPTNDQGGVQGFPLHYRLLSHFSPVFKTHLQSVIATEEEDRNRKVKMLDVKVFNYQNELAFYPRTRAGPSDFDENSDCNYSEEYPAEDSIITVPVSILLPKSSAQPRKMFLPEDVGPVTARTFAALMSWLYLGQEFVNDVKAVSMIELWVFAGRLGMKVCQNDCIVGIEKHRQNRNVVEVGMMEWAWKHTKDWVRVEPQFQDSLEEKRAMAVGTSGNSSDKSDIIHGCPLRNLLVDQCAWFLDEKWLDGVGETGTRNQDVLGVAVLVDLVARLRTLHREGGFSAPGLNELLQIEKRRGTRYWVSEV